mmetsp:Transcript_11556/g.25719  ORF Transcript_11556/g.25719 Transcript_11556/m.25719 type:complete len:236 (+) Transcript_11556:1263-1970(+)
MPQQLEPRPPLVPHLHRPQRQVQPACCSSLLLLPESPLLVRGQAVLHHPSGQLLAARHQSQGAHQPQNPQAHSQFEVVVQHLHHQPPQLAQKPHPELQDQLLAWLHLAPPLRARPEQLACPQPLMPLRAQRGLLQQRPPQGQLLQLHRLILRPHQAHPAAGLQHQSHPARLTHVLPPARQCQLHLAQCHLSHALPPQQRRLQPAHPAHALAPQHQCRLQQEPLKPPCHQGERHHA